MFLPVSISVCTLKGQYSWSLWGGGGLRVDKRKSRLLLQKDL